MHKKKICAVLDHLIFLCFTLDLEWISKFFLLNKAEININYLLGEVFGHLKTDIMVPDVCAINTKPDTVATDVAESTNVHPKIRFNYSLLNILCQKSNKSVPKNPQNKTNLC